MSHRFGVAAVGDPPRCHSCPSNGPGRAPLLPERCRRFGDGKISGFVGMLLFFFIVGISNNGFTLQWII